MTRLALVALIAALTLAACGGSDGDEERAAPNSEAGESAAAAAGGSLKVVATTTILGDIAQNVLCDSATVDTLMSPGQDPHAFELSARQAADLRDADLVIANGLGLEGGFTDVLLDVRDSGTPVVFVAEEVDPIPFAGPRTGDRTSLDPHVWMDPLRMAEAARLIGAEASAASVGDEATACAEDYAATLEALDAEIVSLLDEVDAGSRTLVTNHDALGYFADRYGFEVLGVVVPSGSTLAEPSASDVVDLVQTIRREGVPVIFAETIARSALAEAVAREAGDVEVVTVYTGSLGEPGSGAETYVDMLRTDAERVSVALSR